MKKLFAIIVATVMAISICVGCGAEASAKSEPMFEEVYQGYCYYVVYNTETKVMYAVSDGSSNRGTFTLLVNADGTPMVWDE